jgi:hypothetical protein
MSQEIFYWLTALFIVASVWGAGHLVDYLLQKDSGELVISNEEPPPQVTDSEVPQSQKRNNPQPNGQAGSPKPSKGK